MTSVTLNSHAPVRLSLLAGMMERAAEFLAFWSARNAGNEHVDGLSAHELNDIGLTGPSTHPVIEKALWAA